MEALDNPKVIEIQKQTHKRSYLPWNLLADFMALILSSECKLSIKLEFSEKFLEAQKGLLGKGRIQKSCIGFV